MKVRIENKNGPSSFGTKIFFNDIEQTGIYSAELEISTGDAITLRVAYVIDAIEFESKADVFASVDGKRYKLTEV